MKYTDTINLDGEAQNSDPPSTREDADTPTTPTGKKDPGTPGLLRKARRLAYHQLRVGNKETRKTLMALDKRWMAATKRGDTDEAHTIARVATDLSSISHGETQFLTSRPEEEANGDPPTAAARVRGWLGTRLSYHRSTCARRRNLQHPCRTADQGPHPTPVARDEDHQTPQKTTRPHPLTGGRTRGGEVRISAPETASDSEEEPGAPPLVSDSESGDEEGGALSETGSTLGTSTDTDLIDDPDPPGTDTIYPCPGHHGHAK